MNILFESSKVTDGNMGFKWGEKEEVFSNRERWLGRFGIKHEECVVASLLGGTEVKLVGKVDKGHMVECDALVTTELQVPLFMVTADCFPIGIFDEKHSITALIHAGYKGIRDGVVISTLHEMQRLGGVIQDFNVMVGPGVSPQSYVFPKGEVVQMGSAEWADFLHEDGDLVGVDLGGYLLKQLETQGVTRIEFNGIDTIADVNYFSHYRSKRITGETEGRFGTIAMLSK